MAQRNRSLPLKAPKSRQALGLTHPNAAGIDIGSASHFVAAPPGRDREPVRAVKRLTAALHALAHWLTACGVDTVAMESTGVYWIPVYELLDRRGFKVLLVNARHVKNVSGRKSDVLDCQWLQQLMSYGLLHGAFRPADAVLCPAFAVAPARDAAQGPCPACSAHAQGSDPDEHPVGQRHLRRRRRDRPEDPARHRRRRTRRPRPGRHEERPHPRQRQTSPT